MKPSHEPEVPLSFRGRAALLWRRHRKLFWMLHSAWALATGTVVVLLARERYHLVLWVVVFLVVTWTSTLFFGRAAVVEGGRSPGLVHEVTSYVTRVLYQETLFFLLPFYAYSTVVGSPNVVFLVALAGLAAFACIDLLFDRLLSTRPVLSLMYFGVVAFAAINLLLPLLVGLPPRSATPVAALLAIGSAAVLALRTGPNTPRVHLRLVAAAVVLLAVVVGIPALVPPVPLRVEHATFSTGIERSTLALADTLTDRVSSTALAGSLYLLVEVFAPSALPTDVQLEWSRDGEVLRLSREVGITAHAEGFRVWDGWHAPSGSVPRGRYRVVLRTQRRRVFAVAKLTVY